MTGSTRRIGRSLLIALLVWGLTTGAVGLAAAGDPADTVPDELNVPSPHQGDTGRYDRTVVERVDGETRVVNASLDVVGFTWREPRIRRDADGQAHLVNRLSVRTRDADEPWDHRNHSFVAGTGHAIASEDRRTWTWDPPGEAPERETVTHVRYHQQGPHHIPCGLRNPLQGETVDPSGPVRLFDDGCRSHTMLPLGRIEFEAVGTARVAGHDTVVFASRQETLTADVERDGETWTYEVPVDVHVWIGDDLPYPLKIVSRSYTLDDIDADARTVTYEPDDRYIVQRLDAIRRGDEPIAAEDDPGDVQEAPGIELAPRQVYGPSEAGVDHPFPLSEAFQRARDNPTNDTLRTYLETHPDAYVAFAQNRRTHDRRPDTHDRTVRSWWFVVTDGDSTLGVSVYATQYHPEEGTDLDQPTPQPTQHQYVYEEGAWSADRYPDPGRVPDAVPTVASTMTRWEAYAATEGGAPGEPNHWRFQIECFRPCDEDPSLHVRFDAGYKVLHENASGERARISRLEVDDVGRTRSFEDRVQTAGSDPDPSPLTHHDGYDLQGQDLQVPLWRLPTEEFLFGAGLLGAVLGALYYAWPAVKGLPFLPGWTRLSRDELLDHETRAGIVDVLQERPGLHIAGIADALEIQESTARHHLAKLRDADLLVERSAAGYVCYFPAGDVDRRMMDALPVLRSDAARRVLEAVIAEPGASNQAIAEAVDLAPSTVNHHVQRLEEAGLVERERRGRRVAVHPTPTAERIDERFGPAS